MTYSWKAFAASRQDLANRLGDVNKVFWVDAELGIYIQDSLRMFNSIALFNRDRVTFNTQNGIAFYDLTSTANVDTVVGGTGVGGTNPPAMLGFSTKDQNLVNFLQYQLIEQPTTDWVTNYPPFTSQFTNDDLVRAVERRRNLFLLETGLHISHSQVAYANPTLGRITLADNIIDVRRGNWLSSGNVWSNLNRTDEWEANMMLQGWNVGQAVIPNNYSIYLTPRVSIQLIPFFNGNGTVDLFTVNAPTDLNTTNGVLLNIPEDFVWVVRFGALADLLSKDGEAYDPTRSGYCQQIWNQGLQIAMAYECISEAYIGNNAVVPNSIKDLDYLNYNWQNVTGTPTDLAIVGRNIIALSPVPNGVYTVTLDIARNHPIPVADTDFLQVGREQYDVIIDLAFHLAMFKVYGAEFMATYPLLDRFMHVATYHNYRLSAEARNFSIMRGFSSKENIDRARIDKPDDEKVA